jgi:hypothetical protein
VLLPQLEAEILLADKGFDAGQRVIPPAPGWLAGPFNFKTAPESLSSKPRRLQRVHSIS